jgi:hypothetical protein
MTWISDIYNQGMVGLFADWRDIRVPTPEVDCTLLGARASKGMAGAMGLEPGCQMIEG